MTLDEYQTQAQAFNIVPTDKRMAHAFAGIAEEVGELLGAYKRQVRGDYLHEPLKYDQRVHAELGDCLWYLADLCELHGYSLGEVAQSNLEKLKERASRDVIKGDGEERENNATI